MGLFDSASSQEISANAPLAARMRPTNLDEFVGQEQILGPKSVLRKELEADRLGSVIFWGPPGCGKSTLARIIAARTQSRFVEFSAVTSGIVEVRKAMEEARQDQQFYGKRTILFIDEIHRFNKAQQDAFLPHVEEGTITLLGATTENPYFSVISPLLSRSRVVQFEELTVEHLSTLMHRALTDTQHGLGNIPATIDPKAEELLIRFAAGDARAMLNTLESAVTLTKPQADGVRHLGIDEMQSVLQQRNIRYDREGDEHYHTISAFIKSVRGSDPDAALHYLARMLKAGEDPRFIARRLIILASEDIGNADPRGISVAVAAMQAVEMIGMPEGRIILAQAVTYLATAPKSNAAYLAIDKAMADLDAQPAAAVPLHLKSTGYSGAKKMGHGRDYVYPHDCPGHWVAQQYLPDGNWQTPYYEPTNQGWEAKIAERMQALSPVHPPTAPTPEIIATPQIEEHQPIMSQPKLSEWIDTHLEELVQHLQQFVSIPSVKSAAQPGAPFGTEIGKAMEYACTLAESFGFSAKRFDGYAAHMDMGDAADSVAILAHVDVVPPGDAWTKQPFGGVLIDGYLYGRGTVDDKGAVIAGLFAMRVIKELGLPIKHRIRMIIGGDEESGWECMKHYLQHETERPVCGFSPDGDWPLIFAEKGIINLHVNAKQSEPASGAIIRWAEGGQRANMVPDLAQALLSGVTTDEITKACPDTDRLSIEKQTDGLLVSIKGASSHGATPELGTNAVALLLRTLADAGFKENYPWLSPVTELAESLDGGAYGVSLSDEVSGHLTSNMGVFAFDGCEMNASINQRCPVTIDCEQTVQTQQELLEKLGLTLSSYTIQPPLYVPQEIEFVQKLLQAYREVTGDQTPPQAIGGGTYARVAPNLVAVGSHFAGDGPYHGPDERVAVESLRRLCELIARMAFSLAE